MLSIDQKNEPSSRVPSDSTPQKHRRRGYGDRPAPNNGGRRFRPILVSLDWAS